MIEIEQRALREVCVTHGWCQWGAWTMGPKTFGVGGLQDFSKSGKSSVNPLEWGGEVGRSRSPIKGEFPGRKGMVFSARGMRGRS